MGLHPPEIQKTSQDSRKVNSPKTMNKKAKGELNLLLHRDFLTIYTDCLRTPFPLDLKKTKGPFIFRGDQRSSLAR